MKHTIYYVDYDADDDDGVVLMVMSTVVCGPYPGTLMIFPHLRVARLKFLRELINHPSWKFS